MFDVFRRAYLHKSEKIVSILTKLTNVTIISAAVTWQDEKKIKLGNENILPDSAPKVRKDNITSKFRTKFQFVSGSGNH